MPDKIAEFGDLVRFQRAGIKRRDRNRHLDQLLFALLGGDDDLPKADIVLGCLRCLLRQDWVCQRTECNCQR